MDQLFRLYRYLAQNRQSDDSYENAFNVLENFLDILQKLEAWGHDCAYIGSNEVDEVREELIEGVQSLLCKNADTPTDAVMWLIESHEEQINLDRLMTFIEHRKAKQKEEQESWMMVDDHPF